VWITDFILEMLDEPLRQEEQVNVINTFNPSAFAAAIS